MAQHESISDEIVQFVDDEKGYLRWLESNPNGFLVNSARTPSPSYLVLHRATCTHVSSSQKSNWTTTGYIKTCSDEVKNLNNWAREIIGGELQLCAACKPELERSMAQPPVRAIVNVAALKTDSARDLIREATSSIQRKREVPGTISSGCPELDLVWKTFAADILARPHVLIADTEEDLNWHAFLGHSLDMQGFRAAEFVGVDPLSKSAPGFVPLQRRGVGIQQLADLWEVPAIQQHLLGKTNGTPLGTSLDVIKAAGGEIGRSLAEAFETFPYRKGHWTIRAYLQNCAVLKNHGYSFRRWLESEARRLGVTSFPPTDFQAPATATGLTVEMAIRKQLMLTFHRVGEAMAPYMICDWQLGLWNEGRTSVFANFKLDSFHEEFVKRFGRGLIPTDEQGFAAWWFSLYPDLPPRLANECIWLGIEKGIVEKT